ncbi:MAG: hypothetical protein ACXAD7_03740 [Candidatus Kariarchaeaceae archaeon]|jgi:hypothetical protein
MRHVYLLLLSLIFASVFLTSSKGSQDLTLQEESRILAQITITGTQGFSYGPVDYVTIWMEITNSSSSLTVPIEDNFRLQNGSEGEYDILSMIPNSKNRVIQLLSDGQDNPLAFQFGVFVDTGAGESFPMDVTESTMFDLTPDFQNGSITSINLILKSVEYITRNDYTQMWFDIEWQFIGYWVDLDSISEPISREFTINNGRWEEIAQTGGELRIGLNWHLQTLFCLFMISLTVKRKFYRKLL